MAIARFEGGCGSDADAGRGFYSLCERAAVAAIQHPHLPLLTGLIHRFFDEIRFDGCRAQAITIRVFYCQIQRAEFIAHPVPRKIRDKQIIGFLLVKKKCQLPRSRRRIAGSTRPLLHRMHRGLVLSARARSLQRPCPAQSIARGRGQCIPCCR